MPSWMPDWIRAHDEAWLLMQCAGAVLLGLLLHAVLHRVAQRLTRWSVMAKELVRYARQPAQLLMPLLLLQSVISDVQPAMPRLERWLGIAAMLLATWLVIRLVQATAATVQDRYPMDAPDNLRARAVRTQTRVLARTAMFIIGLVGVASVLMTFPGVRQLGTSLLASAGVAGIAAGLAARPVLGNLIAGMQIAITQPIRLDDVLIVENEWGRVEEITATYVVVRIWDDRRLVVPLQYFIEQPFQNWTRSSSDLLGQVMFYVDYGIPVDPLRDELKRICEACPEWDRRVCVLQVTDCTDRSVQLRALVSSRDAGSNFDLRCKVREQMLGFMQTQYPSYLPRTRNQVLTAPGSEASDEHPAAPSAQARAMAAASQDPLANANANGQATP